MSIVNYSIPLVTIAGCVQSMLVTRSGKTVEHTIDLVASNAIKLHAELVAFPSMGVHACCTHWQAQSSTETYVLSRLVLQALHEDVKNINTAVEQTAADSQVKPSIDRSRLVELRDWRLQVVQSYSMTIVGAVRKLEPQADTIDAAINGRFREGDCGVCWNMK